MEKWKKIKLLALDVDGVMTDGRIFLDGSGEWRRFFYIRDGIGLLQLKARGYKLAIITTSVAEDIRQRAGKLQVDYFYEGAHSKADAFADLLKKSALKSEEIAFIGDDVIDLPVFELCGLKVSPADAHPTVRKSADHITSERGGFGAVRELCDQLLERGPL